MPGEFRKGVLGNTDEGIIKGDCNTFSSCRELPSIRCRQYARSAMESVHLAGKAMPMFRRYPVIVKNSKPLGGRPSCQAKRIAKNGSHSVMDQADGDFYVSSKFGCSHWATLAFDGQTRTILI